MVSAMRGYHPRSLAATATFMGFGIITVYIGQHVLGVYSELAGTPWQKGRSVELIRQM
jgi:hypothetical protein